MVDLQTQYQRIKQDIDAGIQEVIESAAFIKGPKVAAFQEHLEQYTGAKHVIPVGNGTDALQIALMGLGLKPGDEVITPTFTFIATAEVVALLGLTPVVVDVDWETMNMDIEAVRRAITPHTKAIVPVHLFGQCAEMEALMALAKEHGSGHWCQVHAQQRRDASGRYDRSYRLHQFLPLEEPGLLRRRRCHLHQRRRAGRTDARHRQPRNGGALPS